MLRSLRKPPRKRGNHWTLCVLEPTQGPKAVFHAVKGKKGVLIGEEKGTKTGEGRGEEKRDGGREERQIMLRMFESILRNHILYLHKITYIYIHVYMCIHIYRLNEIIPLLPTCQSHRLTKTPVAGMNNLFPSCWLR